MLRALLLAALLLPTVATAAKITVPLDVGIGPAAYYFFGPVNDERWPIPHFGLKLSLAAVIDRELIDRNRNAIPKRYRKLASGVSEVRISPSIFIPDAFIISPKLPALGSTGMYGVTWRPASVGVPIGGGPKSAGRISLEAGLILTYLFLHSDTLPTTHFIRPGIDLMVEIELAASKSFLVSFGWASQIYVPQQLGSLGIGPLRESIFHVGQAFLKLHFRTPYDAKF
jgi:hypothetical protein